MKLILAIAVAFAITAAVVAVVLIQPWDSDSKTDAEQASAALAAGLALHVADDLAGAEAKYLEVLTHDPQNKFALYNLGVIDQGRENAAAAENRYRLALNTDPAYTPALFNLAILRQEAGDLLESLDLYRQVIAVEDTHAAAHFNSGLILIDLDRQAEGDGELARAIQLNPELASRLPQVPDAPTGEATDPEPPATSEDSLVAEDDAPAE